MQAPVDMYFVFSNGFGGHHDFRALQKDTIYLRYSSDIKNELESTK